MVSSHWFLKFRIRIRDYYGTVVVGQERDGPSLWRSITCWPVADNISDGPNYGTLKIEHRLFNLCQSALVSNTIQMDSCLYLQKLSSAQW